MTVGQSIRYAEKFIGRTGVVYTFPLDEYEYKASQAYRSLAVQVVGADYTWDVAGSNPWPMGEGVEEIHFIIVADTYISAEQQYNSLTSSLRLGGLGQLWVLNADGTRRWAYAKLTGRPDFDVSTTRLGVIPVALKFTRFSDWFGETLIINQVTLSQVTQNFVINNPGDQYVRAMVLLWTSLSSTGFSHPSLANISLGMNVATSRAAATVNSRLRIRPELDSIQYSNDAGVSYANDYSLATLPAGQVPMMTLQPGDNAMVHTNTGTPNATLSWSFYPAYN